MKRFIHSLRFATAGIIAAYSHGQNIWLQSILGILALALGWLYRITAVEWLIVLLCIGAVLSLEILNTALEILCDKLSPEKHEKIKLVKDMAAGAVLVASLVAAIAGGIIFLPYILSL